MTTIHPKVAAGMVGTWVGIVGLWALGTYGHVTPPPDVAAAIAGLLSFMVSYLVPNSD
ncbi:MAG: hypothetical protein ACYDAY_11975 [Candidatus Dormibacteria bacterium]